MTVGASLLMMLGGFLVWFSGRRTSGLKHS